MFAPVATGSMIGKKLLCIVFRLPFKLKQNSVEYMIYMQKSTKKRLFKKKHIRKEQTTYESMDSSEQAEQKGTKGTSQHAARELERRMPRDAHDTKRKGLQSEQSKTATF